MEQQITTTEQPNFNIQTLLAQAIDKNIPVETMEKLLAMAQVMKAEWAKEEFHKAISGFQADCPTIEKKKHVNDKYGKLRYKYAPLESIVEQVKIPLNKNGISYSIDTDVQPTAVKAIVKITHISGHSESSSFQVPIDPESYMNQPQKFASALTFAKRYAFCNALGILTGDEDDDSNSNDTQTPKLTTASQRLNTSLNAGSPSGFNTAPKSTNVSSLPNKAVVATPVPLETTPGGQLERYMDFMRFIGEAKDEKELNEIGEEIKKDKFSVAQTSALRSKFKARKSILVVSEPATLKDYEREGFFPEELGHNPN